VAPDTFKSRGVRQPDGTWLVQTPDGPVRLDDAGNLVESPEDKRVKRQLEDAQTREGVLSRIVATAQGGAQGFVPQLAGLKAAREGGDYGEARDAARRSVDLAVEDAGAGYVMAGQLASSGLVGAETAAARIAVGGALGAANAASASNLDLAETLKGAALGVGVGAAGEVLGAGVRAAAGKVSSMASRAVARQTAKDAAAVEKEIASLTGKLGGETQKGSRLLENLQRAATGEPAPGAAVAVGESVQEAALQALRSPEAQELAEQVTGSALKAYPGQKATIDRLAAELAAKTAGAKQEAAQRTADYFAAPIWQTEVLPRLKTLAPRFGLAAAGAVAGGAVSTLAGTDGGLGLGLSGGFIGAVLGAPGVRMMMKNVANSPRVQFAVGTRLAPLLEGAATAISRGITPTAQVLAGLTLTEEHLGDQTLAAEQLVARGGLDSVLGRHPPDVGEATGVNAPQTPLDAAIRQTAAIVALGGALERHHDEIDRGVDAFLKGSDKPLVRAKDAAAKAKSDAPAAVADPVAMVDRMAANTGSLAEVAPGVHAALTDVAQRAAQHLAELEAGPPPKGPLSRPRWPSESEQRLSAAARAVADDPLRILELARTGRLTGEAMRTATAIYPALTRAIGDRALDAAMEAGGKLSRTQLLMLSLLAGVDVDGQLGDTAANQRTIHAQSSKPSLAGTPEGSPAKPDPGKLTLGQRMAPPHARRERDE
jgi:hypothetical protein